MYMVYDVLTFFVRIIENFKIAYFDFMNCMSLLENLLHSYEIILLYQ